MRHVVVGTAGHIDHGKSALVRALTGVDPDRLKEEKARGITIELGFADLALDEERTVSFVDVPGHERFVRHMVAGATGIDAVVLVVAADAGVQPQTREHLDICRLLGVRHGVVALSKIDLVDDELREVVELELREALAGTFLETAPILPVSSRDGAGLEPLRTELCALVDRIDPRPGGGVTRMPIDRSFVLRGFGTVVTGTLAAGRLVEGQEVAIEPTGTRARVRGLQVHGRKVVEARAGQRTAANLQGVSTDDAPRGATLVDPGALSLTRRCWARVTWLDHAPESLRGGGRLRFHHGTRDQGARLRPLGPAPDGRVDVEMFLDDDALLAPGDRFILRQTAPLDTVGGGVVLDIRPPRERAARDERLRLDGGLDAAIEVRLSRAGRAGADGRELAGELGVAVADLEAVLARHRDDGRAVVLAGRWFAVDGLGALAADLADVLDAFHRREPLRSGVSRERVRAEICPDMPVDSWRVWLDGLRSSGVVRLDGERLASASHQVVLSERERSVADRIESRFREAGLEPPDVGEVTREAGGDLAERLIDRLIEDGRLVRIRDGRPFHAEAIEGLHRRLAEYRRTSTRIDVATFKELFGVTRKNAIPLLEHLDAERRTRRVGNVREILEG